jgi:outer membrane receptor protein involved in Fe transport
MRLRIRGCGLLLGLLPASAALAQISTSVLVGNVVDASTRAPVADVVVTATSPSLQGEQVVVTDVTGLYRVPQLPSGAYTLRFEKESYRPFSRSGIEVAADQTLRLNVELLPETAGTETVTVIGTPPIIDIGSTATGTTVNQEFMQNLAVARPGGLGGANRSFDSLATTAPQANPDFYGVGINGATSPENLFLIDGISVNNPGFGTLGTPLTAEFMDEINIITGGYMPEYGRTSGGVISAATKSGGNEFHGSVFGTFTPGSLSGAPGTVAGGATPTVQGKREVGNLGDIGATLGGYLVKDRLWFFVGVQWSAQRYIYSRSFNRSVNGQTQAIPNSTQRRNGDERSINYIGKLTYLISSDHRVSLTVVGTPTTGGGEGGVVFRGRSSNRGPFAPTLLTFSTFNARYTRTKFDALDVAAELRSSFLDKRLLLDVRFGLHLQRDSLLPGDGSGLDDIENRNVLAGVPFVSSPALVPTPVYELDASVPSSVRRACTEQGASCNVQGFGTGGPGPIGTLDFTSYQARGVLTYLVNAAGHHVLKAGFDAQINKYDRDQSLTGGASYADGQDLGAPAGTVYDTGHFGYLANTDVIVERLRVQTNTQSTILGGFIQDSWSVLDKVTLNLGLRYDALTMQGHDGKTRLSLQDQLSPRIGLVWDPTQQGWSKVFVNYGRYFEYIPLDIADRSLSSSQSGIQGLHLCDPLQVGRTGCNGNTRTDGQSFLNGVTQAPNRKWGANGAPYASYVDPNLKSPANDEIVAGAEYEVLPSARAGLTYTYRNLVRTVEDMSNNDAQTYFIGNPGEGIGDTFPKAKRTYHAVTALFSKSFSDLWLAQASYTWAELRGNYEGLFGTQSFGLLGVPQLDPNINGTFDLRTLMLNQTGPLPSDITHNIKLYLAKEFAITPVFSVTLGGSFNANSGPPINALGRHPIYGGGQVFILERGSAGRLPWVTALDAKLSLNYRVGKGTVITAAVEGFNLLHSQRPVTVNEIYTVATVTPILGAKQGSVPTEFGGVCADATAASCASGNGSLPRPRVDPNSSSGGAIRVGLPNQNGALSSRVASLTWGTPTNYQPVRQFRFSLRVTF